MNLGIHLIVRRTHNKKASSSEHADACGRSKTIRKSACCAPHAPYKSESHSAFGELRIRFRRLSSDGHALKRLRLSTCDRKNPAFKAASSELNLRGEITSLRCYRKPSPSCAWRLQVTELDHSAKIQSVLGIVQSLADAFRSRNSLPAPLPIATKDQQSRRLHVPKARQIQRTIDINRLTEAPLMPLLAVQRIRSAYTYSLKITPAQH